MIRTRKLYDGFKSDQEAKEFYLNNKKKGE